MKKIISTVIFIFVALTVQQSFNISNNWYKDFIPSKECCGAARNAKNDYIDYFDEINEINCRIKCMVAGYKKVYWGIERELSYIAEEFLPLENLGIRIIRVENGINFNNNLEEKSIILYMPAGKEEALMLEEYEHVFAKKYSHNPKKELNHYLIGKLLNYNYEDIEYFYTANKIKDFEKDKEKAERFLNKHHRNPRQ